MILRDGPALLEPFCFTFNHRRVGPFAMGLIFPVRQLHAVADDASQLERGDGSHARGRTEMCGKNSTLVFSEWGQPGVTDIRFWGAHERVTVKRTRAEDGERWCDCDPAPRGSERRGTRRSGRRGRH
jgi:hypothetical protein